MPPTAVSGSTRCPATSLGFPLEKGTCYNPPRDRNPKTPAGNPKKPVRNPKRPTGNPLPAPTALQPRPPAEERRISVRSLPAWHILCGRLSPFCSQGQLITPLNYPDWFRSGRRLRGGRPAVAAALPPGAPPPRLPFLLPSSPLPPTRIRPRAGMYGRIRCVDAYITPPVFRIEA